MADQREIQVKPQTGVYTVLLIITILALGTSTGFVANRLLGPMPGTSNVDKDANGYGMEIGDLFKPWAEVEKQAGVDKFSKDIYAAPADTGGIEDEMDDLEPEPEPELDPEPTEPV